MASITYIPFPLPPSLAGHDLRFCRPSSTSLIAIHTILLPFSSLTPLPLFTSGGTHESVRVCGDISQHRQSVVPSLGQALPAYTFWAGASVKKSKDTA